MLSVSYIPALNVSWVPSTKLHCYRVSACSSTDISALASNALRSWNKSSHGTQYCLIYSVKETLETAKDSRKWVCTELWELPYLWRRLVSLRLVAICCVGIFGGGESTVCGQSFSAGYPWYQPPPSPAFREVWESSWWWNSIAQENIAKAGMWDVIFFSQISHLVPLRVAGSMAFSTKKWLCSDI